VSEKNLEAALRELGARLDVPEPPDMSAAVLARLDEKRPRWRPVHRVIAAAVAAALALATAMVVSPAVRATVYDLLRIGGVEIHENEPAPVAPVPSVEPPLPGERDVSLDEARAAVDFPLQVPQGLGPPATVRLIDGGRVVSMAFGSPHGQIRLDQFDGGLDPMFNKFATAEDVQQVAVSGMPAIWVNRPHVVIYTGRDGKLHQESARLAANTLIWENGISSYRLEGKLTRRQAIEIAESLR
jgi:hypothetical protein